LIKQLAYIVTIAIMLVLVLRVYIVDDDDDELYELLYKTERGYKVI